MPRLDQRARDALGWVGLIAVACLVVGGFAFTRPAERDITVDATYDQTGQFSYGAAAPNGIYDAKDAVTGDPIYREVSDSLGVSFDYALSSALPASVSGSWDLNAILSTDNGWFRTIPLLTDQTFDGSAFHAQATIDLGELKVITDRVAAETGVSHDRFVLKVVPNVAVQGSISGQEFTDTFTPELAFSADPMELTFAGSGGDDALAPTKTGIVKLPETETNTIPVLQWEVAVPLARMAAIAGLLLSIVIAGGIALVSLRSGRADSTGLLSRYNAMLVDISDPDPAMSATGQVVAVRSFDDLARLAERDGQVILRHAANDFERFIVRCADITYLYSAASGAVR